jgi:hypothetical protein
VGGEYNAVSNNNIGAACKADSECYSPFGAGRCLRYGLPNNQSSPGICTVIDCNAPGLPDELCGSGNECVGSSADQTLCVHQCAAASECAAGFACTDDDGIPSSAKICYPVCEADADCRSNERCKPFPSLMVGQCVLQ